MSKEMKLLAILLAERTDKYFKNDLATKYPFFLLILDDLDLFSEEYYFELSWEQIFNKITSHYEEDIDFIYKKLNSYYLRTEKECEE